jgi:hypothetical protein
MLRRWHARVVDVDVDSLLHFIFLMMHSALPLFVCLLPVAWTGLLILTLRTIR